MQKVIEDFNKKGLTTELFKQGFISGIGWSFGVTVGFVIISSIIVVILQGLGGLPLIGSFIANIVQETQAQLLIRTPIFPNY